MMTEDTYAVGLDIALMCQTVTYTQSANGYLLLDLQPYSPG